MHTHIRIHICIHIHMHTSSLTHILYTFVLAFGLVPTAVCIMTLHIVMII